MSFQTFNNVYKIIRQVSNKENRYTIDLKKFYRGIVEKNPEIKIYCIPKKIETLDSDIGYEIETEDLGNYVYRVSPSYLGLTQAPKTLHNKEHRLEETGNISFSIKLDKYCRKLYLSLTASFFVQDGYVRFYIDGVEKKSIYIPRDRGDVSYYPITTFITMEDIYNEHTLKVETDMNIYTGWNAGYQHLRIAILSDNYSKFSNIKDEINCFFIIKEEV